MTIDELRATPFKPSKKDIRTVMSSVFGHTDVDECSAIEATVVLAYKVLRDTGHEVEQLLAIFQFFREAIEEWSWDKNRRSPLVLVISNNRYASVLVKPSDKRLYDFRKFTQVRPTDAPIVLQVSVVLSGLYVLAGGTLPLRSYSQLGAVADEAAPVESPDCS